MNKKLSILIITHFRHNYLRRCLDYYSNFENVNILVADSTDKEFQDKNKYPDIEYYHYPGFKIYEKIIDTLEKVKTPYCTLVGDDDFIIPNNAIKCAEYIENNKDEYVCAIGDMVRFKLNPHTNKYDWYRSYPHIRSIENNSPEGRIESHFLKYGFSLYYAVMNTEILIDTWKKFKSYNLDNEYRFSELLVNMIPLIQGKLKYTDTLFAAKEANTNSLSGQVPVLKSYFYNSMFKRFYPPFKNCLVDELGCVTDLSLEERKLFIDKCFTTYLNKKRNKPKPLKHYIFIGYLRKPKYYLIKSLAFILKKLHLYDFTKNVLFSNKSKKIKYSIPANCEITYNNQSNSEYKEWKKIYDVLEKHKLDCGSVKYETYIL